MTHAPSIPLIPEVGVLAMPYHHFGTKWMTPHHVMTRLASYFNVLWLEPPHHWREIRQQPQRRQAMARLLRSLPKAFDVYVSEPWLFNTYRPEWLHHRLFQIRVQRAWQQLERRGCTKRVLHLWHYNFEPALAVGRHDLSLYHIDDEYSFTPDPPPMPAAERRVIGAVDQVFAISPGLLERKGGINPRMAFAPEGVDYALYATPVPEPPDIAGIPHPRVGYTGTLKVQLDWRLLRDLARRHPAWSFVFVGPRVLDDATGPILDEMERMPNVHLLGQKTVKDLAAYPQHFDVCVMPYLVNGYTNNIYPLKLHEYLATGKPVVGSSIRSLKDFDKVITLADSTSEWSDALSSALTPVAMSPDTVAARRQVARQYDWSELTFDIARTICDRLGPAHASRVRKLAVDTPTLAP